MQKEYNMKTLKLDLSYRPIGIIDCLEALVMCIVGKAVAVEEYEEEISSPSVTFRIPSVIVLRRVVKYMSNSLNANRTNILWRDKNQCQYCGVIQTPKELTLDHVLPKSRDGENTWTNLVTCCKKCNQEKRDRTPEEAGMSLLKKPKAPKYSILRDVKNVSPSWKLYLW
jgi:5-methylcytosine-specific restriction endonuclease McrA